MRSGNFFKGVAITSLWPQRLTAWTHAEGLVATQVPFREAHAKQHSV